MCPLHLTRQHLETQVITRSSFVGILFVLLQFFKNAKGGNSIIWLLIVSFFLGTQGRVVLEKAKADPFALVLSVHVPGVEVRDVSTADMVGGTGDRGVWSWS